MGQEPRVGLPKHREVCLINRRGSLWMISSRFVRLLSHICLFRSMGHSQIVQRRSLCSAKREHCLEEHVPSSIY